MQTTYEFRLPGYHCDEDMVSSSPGLAAQFEAAMPFTDREGYREWLAAWKQAVAEHVAIVRAFKAQRRDTSLSVDARCSAHLKRQDQRPQGHNLYLLRRLAKVRACQQHEAAKLQVAA